MIFKTLEELHKECEVNGSCNSGTAFNKSCTSLNEVFEKCPINLRMWRLIKGYTQFSEHCDWSKLSWNGWCILLIYKPQFAEYKQIKTK